MATEVRNCNNNSKKTFQSSQSLDFKFFKIAKLPQTEISSVHIFILEGEG